MKFKSLLSAVLYFTLGVVMTTFLFLNSATLVLFREGLDVTSEGVGTLGGEQLKQIMKGRLPKQFGDDDGDTVGDDKLDMLTAVANVWRHEFNKLSDTEEVLRHRMQMQEKPCRCHKNQTFPLDEATNARRLEQALLWQREQAEKREPLGVCKSMSPISYVGNGIVVEPLLPSRLVGLRVDPLFQTLFPVSVYSRELTVKIITRKTIAKLVIGRTNIPSHDFLILGNNTREITIKSNSVETLNILLDNLIYKSIIYDISIRDIVDVNFMGFVVQVHVHVRRQTLPDLYDFGPLATLADKVTVVTKTFERYEAINRLVDSINKFYPDVRIVVADDSEVPQRIVGRNVKQTIMPFAEGLFAGRGVALSQVTTKYFLWVDDDFVFTEQTKLEYMLEKLEDPFSKLDLVGGTVNGKSYNKCFIFNMADKMATAFARYTVVITNWINFLSAMSLTWWSIFSWPKRRSSDRWALIQNIAGLVTRHSLLMDSVK
ncbi:beta-1,4 N-acetylgalactosaminyltransferase 2-like [Ptychodera flava]|uniref:beta-1,4 N-acetylgalactosaminyltransferase 2-like n=1 Tax=Ptychodera flava TaxID=63121 RepID=UPI00396A62B3